MVQNRTIFTMAGQ